MPFSATPAQKKTYLLTCVDHIAEDAKQVREYDKRSGCSDKVLVSTTPAREAYPLTYSHHAAHQHEDYHYRCTGHIVIDKSPKRTVSEITWYICYDGDLKRLSLEIPKDKIKVYITKRASPRAKVLQPTLKITLSTQ